MKKMRIKWDELIISILIPIAVGVVSGLLTRNSMMMFNTVKKPPLSPPGWLFPVVWTILYILMGIASYLIYQYGIGREDVRLALTTYAVQLFFNFFWSIFFFNLEWYLFAFLWLAIMWFLILLTIIRFSKIDKTAAYLMIPYLVWVTLAAYLNLGIYFLNR